jgi:YD repeat-containing protein
MTIPDEIQAPRMTGSPAPIIVRLKFGRFECRSWLEAEACDDGLRLVGMSSRTEYDEAGKLVSHVCEGGSVTWAPNAKLTGPSENQGNTDEHH